LRERFVHLRALNSAWSVLANFELAAEARHLAEAGRSLGADLAELASQSVEMRDPARLPKLDKILDAIEQEVRTLAFDIPVAELRAGLPSRLPQERVAVLDLLDLMLVSELENEDVAGGRLSAIDYLVTLLCSGDRADGALLQDPTGLTPRLFTLCERAQAADTPALDAAEADFYAAAEVDDAEARDEQKLVAMRRRKRELGPHFFVPRVLRAIVTYNAALSASIERGVHDSRDWGSLAAASESGSSESALFETEVLPRIAEAIARRTSGAAPSSSAVDRVAWCLDLDSLDEPARDVLAHPGVGRRENVEGTAILVGLLCRSAVVLDSEFPAIGIAPERLAGEWVRELDATLKRKVNEQIAGDSYEQACSVSELRNTFLYSLITDVNREKREPQRRVEVPRFQEVEQEARQLAGAAVEHREAPPARTPRLDLGSLQRGTQRHVLGLLGAAAVIGAIAILLTHTLLASDLEGFSSTELHQVSPHLEAGSRNGEGSGTGFVGTLGDGWEQLSPSKQEAAAGRLVRTLQAKGVREVMIYDDSRRLRIQSLGTRSIRVLPAAGL
jgi:hypothetical protein